MEKMFFKPSYAIALIHVPEELQKELKQSNASQTLHGTFNFILTFYKTKSELEKEANTVKIALENEGLLWIAYPKGKALSTDLNRDILHEIMKQYAMDGISLISLNQTWSAMRFKKLT